MTRRAAILVLDGVGIGPAPDLARHGIPVVRDLPGVGENYQDHAVVYVTFEAATEFDADWVVPRFRLLIRHHAAGPAPNFHVNMRPPTAVRGLKRLLPISAHLIEQRARGRVTLRSGDPSAAAFRSLGSGSGAVASIPPRCTR